MAKADTFGKPAIRRDGTSASLRDYTSLLGVVAAGILGMSLLCITSAIALSNPDPSNPIVLEPASIVDMAISNLNTVSALTVQAVPLSIDSTPILFPTDTSIPASPTLTSSAHPTAIRITSTNTRRPRPTSTGLPPTNTPKPPIPSPTKTLIPSPTNTLIPSPTNTSIPPTTETPIPYPTDTPIPADTDTPVPPDTPIPADTDTPVPFAPADTPTPGI